MAETTEPMDVVFTSPHPDDLEILCGGAIARLVDQGYRVAMVHATTGEPTPQGTEARRRAEAAKAAEVLGVAAMEILTLPNRELMDCPANRYVLATALRRYRPKIVVTMAGRTPLASPDHWQGELLAEASAFYSRLTKWDDRFGDTPPHTISHLVYRRIPRSLSSADWVSSFVVDITSTLARKLAAVGCYESQFGPDRIERLQHWIRSTAGVEGGAAGFTYGEQYYLPRAIGTQDMVSLLSDDVPRKDRSSPG